VLHLINFLLLKSSNTKKIADSVSGTYDASKYPKSLTSKSKIFNVDDNSSKKDSNLSSLSVMSAYNGFSKKVNNSLSSMFTKIPFGVNSFFNIPDYAFVDVPFPAVDINSLHLHLHGLLLSASFFNSLDFTLVKMFIILLTLIWSVKYIFDRLF